VIDSWAANEPTRAAAFVGELEPGAVRDAAVTALAAQFGAASPEQAAQWTQSISDPDLRESVLESLARIGR
jgi:hypothetical protein